MLPLPQLGVVAACYVALAVAARIARPVFLQVRRIGVLLVILFALDWAFIGLPFAVLITLRLVLLATAFTVFAATTTAEELQSALERMGIPARLCFTLATTYRSLGLLETEWRGILEAQQARGIIAAPGWRAWRTNLARAVALLVPAVVLAAQRAWSITEAAAARGVESPLRRPAAAARLSWMDRALLAAAAGLLLGLAACR
jgi:energy-coupling factor transporter transmembrane protein EcfT